MDNLAYLHLAFAYEDCESSELVLLSALLDKASAPNWNKLSGKSTIFPQKKRSDVSNKQQAYQLMAW